MGGILRNWRVLGAALVAVAVIGGSYLVARGINDPSIAEASAETALLQAAASKDSTGDGLPDWQKVLYGIPLDATTTDYFHLGMTDGEAVAKGLIVPKAVANVPDTATSTDSGTLTGSFSKAFFTLYLSAKQANNGAALSPDQTQALATEALNQFIETSAPTADPKSMQDLHIGEDQGSAGLLSFASDAEAVFARYALKKNTNELQDLENVLAESDPSASDALLADAQVYQQYATALSTLTIPPELGDPMLRLINAFASRAKVYENVAQSAADPLLGIVSMQQFIQNQDDWLTAFKDIGTVYAANGMDGASGTPGSLFIRAALKVHAANP